MPEPSDYGGAAIPPTKKIGQLLVEREWLTLPQLNQALQHQRFFGGRLGTCLLELNLVSEDRLARALADQQGFPHASADELREIDRETLELIPAKMACRSRVVPFGRFGTQLSVVIADARDLALQDEIGFITSKRLKIHVAPEVRVLEALERHYGCEVELRFQRIWDRLNRARYLWQEETAAVPVPGSREASTATGSKEWRPAPPPELRDVPPAAPPAPAASRPARTPTSAGAPASPSPPAAEPETPPAAGKPTFVEVPAEFRGVIPGTDEETRPVAGLPPAHTVAELETRFAAASERDTLAEATLAYLGQRFSRVLLFMVRGDEVAGWMGRGEGVDPAALPVFALDLEQPSSFLNLRAGSPFFRGPLPAMAAHRKLAELWGGTMPREAFVAPLRIRDRMVAAVYLDQGDRALSAADVEEALNVAAAMTRGFQDLLVRRKKR